MILPQTALHSVVGTFGLVAILAFAYGMVLRRVAPPWLAQTLLGALFGLQAVLQMLNPLAMDGGLTVDMRFLTLALAGAFLGWPGAATSLGLALATRLWIGGTGTAAGAVALVLASLGGLAWAELTPTDRRRGLRDLLRLAALASAGLAVAVLLAPGALAGSDWSVLALLDGLGLLLVGALMERERMILLRESRLRRQAERDPLTGALNRRGFERRAAAVKTPEATLLLIDLDHFKRVNDTYGHPTGDAVLAGVTEAVRRRLRPGDVLGRMGGEEFALLLPRTCPRAAETLARDLCRTVRSQSYGLPGQPGVTVTVSIGGGWADGQAGGPVRLGALMAHADAALYEAKRSGRDCVRLGAERVAA